MDQRVSPERQVAEVTKEAAERQLVLPVGFVASMKGSTPNVKNLRIFACANGGATTVTQFLNGGEGQRIAILGDGNTTITNGTNIKTNTGANKLLAANKVYRFTRINKVWYEDE